MEDGEEAMKREKVKARGDGSGMDGGSHQLQFASTARRVVSVGWVEFLY